MSYFYKMLSFAISGVDNNSLIIRVIKLQSEIVILYFGVIEYIIFVEIHIKQTSCNINYPRLEDNCVYLVEINHAKDTIILNSRINSQIYILQKVIQLFY
jgi:hypothetical protein